MQTTSKQDKNSKKQPLGAPARVPRATNTPSYVMRFIGANIRKHRESKGDHMTTFELARLTGLNRMTISRTEQGKRFKLETLCTIAEALDISIFTLFFPPLYAKSTKKTAPDTK